MSVITPSTAYLLSLSGLRGVGPAALRQVAQVPDFLDEPLETLGRRIPKIQKALDEDQAWEHAEAFARRQQDQAEEADARIISALDTEYPDLLRRTSDAPFFLYVRGRLAPNPDQSVAVIGTREPTHHGKLIAERIARFFAEQHWSVVSGLALGCDGVAHQATLEAQGHTVAILAHGLQTIAPSSHRKLAEQILEQGGALVSEFSFGVKAMGPQFVKRDRTQAGFAQGVVMVQSDVTGGSLHASRAALDYGRWLAVPFPTERDVQHAEPKIGANLLLSSGDDAGKAMLLKCKKEKLQYLRVLKSKDDYPELIDTNVQGAAAGPHFELNDPLI